MNKLTLKNKLPTRYCSYCGEKMILNMRNANKNMMFYGDTSTIPYGSKYNEKTGKRQYCPHFKCSDYKNKKWYYIGGSPHNKYFLNELWIEKEFGVWEKLK